MLVSIFTPTHNSKHLARLAESIHAQTYKNFEWVILLNGEMNNGSSTGWITPDERFNHSYIKFVNYPSSDSRNIGALKKFACGQCHGEILVEVDHDDEITPDCLAELVDAFQDPTIDFVYSNCCEVQDGIKPWTYDEKYGWKYLPFNWKGMPLQECISFDPSPVSFSRIWYAPNHVRAWRSGFYKKIGGHDSTKVILDDQDLLCRTYIHGKIKKINKCLYIYHIHDGNSWSNTDFNSKIQSGTWDIYNKHLEGMISKWCQDNNLEEIRISGAGAGNNGSHKWPYEDASVGVFYLDDFLQHHFSDQTFPEIYRCLAPNGWMISNTPSTDGRGAFQLPYRSYWNENSFWPYTIEYFSKSAGIPELRFQNVRTRTYFPSSWHEQHNIPYVRADLVKYSGRVPGEVFFSKKDIKFTIITPTLDRNTLKRCCDSVLSQTYKNWEHLIIHDTGTHTSGIRTVVRGVGPPVNDGSSDSRVYRYVVPNSPHNDVGNYCRNVAYDYISGDFIIHLDDDNYFLHNRSLEILSKHLNDDVQWGVFPMVMQDTYFFNNPPGLKLTDQNQIFYRPVINGQKIRFPAVTDYDADGKFVEWLKTICDPAVLDIGPLVYYSGVWNEQS